MSDQVLAEAIRAIADGLIRYEQEIAALIAERDEWKGRYEAERSDHETTMKQWDEERAER